MQLTPATVRARRRWILRSWICRTDVWPAAIEAIGRIIELDSSVLRLRNHPRLERRAGVAAHPTQSALQAITESEPAQQERRHQREEEFPPEELQPEEL